MNKYLLYPGCSMDSSARAYLESLNTILEPLDLQLDEIEDWNCCGATEYLGINLIPAYSLIARNLALATKQMDSVNGTGGTRTVITPCSACYLNLAKADHYMQERPALGAKVNEALSAGGLEYKPGTLDVRHLLDILVYDIGLDAIKRKVTRPLNGLKVVPYMGCMLPRPDYKHRWSDHEHPTELDDLLRALGADVIDYPLTTECCGGHMTQIGPETAFELIRRLIAGAHERGAYLMAAVCPMCQLNIDAYQLETNRFFHTHYHMPILFFTQLMGLAFGREPAELGIGAELVSARNALAHIGVEVPVTQEPATPRKKDEGLPMPRRWTRHEEKEAVK
ncbi:MAG: CoB--CoM heterodisulfide reductase iron-sulfur subunit B family protein [Chloroflexi bacterium]|nr:CoB--CoM heterodisulfide reductase iron-sulfur subunit B family protein [Chloroflexota bacterium]MBI3167414.1 CoB--CoM heterodisulfide reductase iron-sulfur subunit B family protein [Chloroflexota bacterium]